MIFQIEAIWCNLQIVNNHLHMNNKIIGISSYGSSRWLTKALISLQWSLVMEEPQGNRIRRCSRILRAFHHKWLPKWIHRLFLRWNNKSISLADLIIQLQEVVMAWPAWLLAHSLLICRVVAWTMLTRCPIMCRLDVTIRLVCSNFNDKGAIATLWTTPNSWSSI